jgi:dihydroorotate dehydrogenase
VNGLSRLAFRLARPALRTLDAEQAHALTIKALKALPHGTPPRPTAESLRCQRFGLTFPNPLGLAAGFDKNGEVPDAMLAQGFGFVELGTVTPRAQAGNPRPRLFRLAEDRAVINRMGFNNAGHAALLARLARRHGQGLVGINIGANKDSEDRGADYVAGIETFSRHASYFTVNISSPNTPGLRNLQAADELRPLLSRLNAARARQVRKVPMLLKIAPDLSPQELAEVATCCGQGAVDGVIISNTTISRPALKSAYWGEAGGLSGAPLFELSTQQLARFYLATEGRILLVGAGGIASAEDAWIKISAGATLLQLYSALVFQGPGLITAVLSGLAQKLKANGMTRLDQAVGLQSRALA